MTPARARLLRPALGAVAMLLVCLGFFVHGLHEWVRVLMFVAIVGVAAWGNGVQTRARVREAVETTPADAVEAPGAQATMQRDLAD